MGTQPTTELGQVSQLVYGALVEAACGCRGRNMGAVWGLHACQSLGMVAYGGEDGEVATFRRPLLGDARQRERHTTILGKSTTGELCRAQKRRLCVLAGS